MGISNVRKNSHLFDFMVMPLEYVKKKIYILVAFSFQFVQPHLCGVVLVLFGWVCLFSFVVNWFSNPSVVSFRWMSFLALTQTC